MKNQKKTTTAKTRVNMTHPMDDSMTTDRALEMAKGFKHGPRDIGLTTIPGIDESIDIIKEKAKSPSLKEIDWISGRRALEVLKASRGEEVEFT